MTILVSPYVVGDGDGPLVAELRGRRPDLDLVHATDDEAVGEAASDAEILVTSYLPEDLLAAAEGLRWMQALSAGTDFLPTDELESRGVALTSASGVHAKPIGQQVLGYLLFFERRFDRAVAQQTRREWERYMGSELGDRTVGIVGVGAIGSQVAAYSQAFDATVVGTKRDTSDVPDGVDELFGSDELETVLDRSDYLVIACPLTEETRGLIDGDALARLDEEAVVVNVARGSIVDQDALVAALQGEDIAGAALDVFEEEPLPEDSPLWDREDVLVTPHVAGSTPHYWERAAELFLDNLDRYRAGEELRNRVV